MGVVTQIVLQLPAEALNLNLEAADLEPDCPLL